MNKFNQLVNEANKNRMKLYYNLAELQELTGLSIRSLKYRMLDIKKKYADAPNLLSKAKREWRIHYHLVEEFQPKYNLKAKPQSAKQFKNLVTWNFKDAYDKEYHIQLVKDVKQQLPESKILYCIELDGRGINHTHFVSDATKIDLDGVVSTTLKQYGLTDFKMRVEPLINTFSTVKYLKKAQQDGGLLL